MHKFVQAALLTASVCTGVLSVSAAEASDSIGFTPQVTSLTGEKKAKPSKNYLFPEATDLKDNNPFINPEEKSWENYYVPYNDGALVYSPVEYSASLKEQNSGASSISAENPLYITADRMQYANTTGEVSAFGDVDIRQQKDRYQTAYAYGNTQTQKYMIPGEVLYTTPTDYMKADSASYDGNAAIGRFSKLRGWDQGVYYFAGESGVYNRAENKIVVQKGFLTTKHAIAKVPDYRIEADSIDIYPGDHYTAHDVSLFIKNTRLLTMSSYTGSLIPDDSNVNMWTLIPRPTYDSDNGIGLKNSVTIPMGGLSSGVSFYAQMAYYTKVGFKPDIGFKWNTRPGTFRLHYAKEESSLNDDHVWVEKKPSLSFDSNHFYIPGTEFFVGFTGEVGRWEEGNVKGTHKDWDAYISHNPIPMGPHMAFSWRAGYRKDYYDYNDTIRNNAYYSMGINGGYGPVAAWINYTNNNLNGQTPYSFDTYDIQRPLSFGVKVQLTPLDAVSVGYTYGTSNHKLEHLDYTYYRDMHSFYGWIEYREKDRETKIYIQPKDFRF